MDANSPIPIHLKTTLCTNFKVNEGWRNAKEGFIVSWHPATALECGKLKCLVRYKNILRNPGLDYFVDGVSISKAAESSSTYNTLGFIRPLPPFVMCGRLEFKFGLCVDVNYQQGWWQGVIFDHCDEMEERSVFFPDLGYEMQFNISLFRITQDWNETTGQWKPRGNWVFLELLEESQPGSLATLSAKQIWYEVKEKTRFGMTGEWTCNVKELYNNEVKDIINDYFQVFSVLNFPESLQDEISYQESVEPMTNVNSNMILPGKGVVIEPEPTPRGKEILPNFGQQMMLDDASEEASGSRCSKRSRSTANQDWKSSRDSKANMSKSQSNELRPQEPRSNKRVTKVSAPRLISSEKPLSILSWLMDNMVISRCNIYYYNEQAGYHSASTMMTTGRITRHGIKCNCCNIVYSIVGFEDHVSGRNTGLPSANIFFKNGKSLLECQIDIMRNLMTKKVDERPSNSFYMEENDFVCSICLFGGELILCDQCPSAFHQACVGLKTIPDGYWHCPQCRCVICGESKVDEDLHGDALACDQCGHKCHATCLENGPLGISTSAEKWFCGDSCKKIYESLHELVGKPIPVGDDNLTWRLVKFIKPETDEHGAARIDGVMAENYSRLNLALALMYECFEQSFTSRNFIDEVIFSKGSDLNRLDFSGFFTVLLERNEEVVCVATLRVHGQKVAEVPLVGTRAHFRKRGFCHILMNGLEQMLTHLGVERIVLPAITSTVKTWTSSFGFAKMSNSERSQLLDCIFLDFEDSILCQKLLKKIPPPHPELQPRCDALPESCVNVNESSLISSGMVDQQMGNAGTSNNDDHGYTVPANTVEKVIPGDRQCFHGSSSKIFDDEDDKDYEDDKDDEDYEDDEEDEDEEDSEDDYYYSKSKRKVRKISK